jgi:hypothetical protein
MRPKQDLQPIQSLHRFLDRSAADRARSAEDHGVGTMVSGRANTMETTMRLVVFSFLLIVGVTSNAAAEEHNQMLPEIVIGGGGGGSAAAPGSGSNSGSNRAADPERCVEVEIGSAKSMDCLNQKLKREVDRVNPSINQPPIDARSPDTKIGVINIPGVKQQYGRNFGVSVVPFRPAPPVAPPLGGRH